MKLELEFVPPEGEMRSTVRIVLNPVGESPMSGLPLVTMNCKSLEEIENQVQAIEKQLGKIRKEAGKFFAIPTK
ncbi:hypothetical protein [Beijerinckia indica]|uniref:Uncharacterized protein n=1 Tax=Beijerinckia indica subsp. indica (strain ATCC 9039 / DSM 1715 / NCIMB 8712) TaxID=395963 RepID=B2IAY1_BEII9|nr:hypothetical protein [Beijerinckia indica]ACB93681.1 hypothetical protein Bind_0022 [Beijerinckia indica subsp. indica ATCC 9039]